MLIGVLCLTLPGVSNQLYQFHIPYVNISWPQDMNSPEYQFRILTVSKLELSLYTL